MESAALRFDNYLILFFTQEATEGVGEIEVEFKGKGHRPEFVFSRRPQRAPERAHVSAYFWIRDLAYADADDLAALSIRDHKRKPVDGFARLGDIGRVEDRAFSTWLNITLEARLFDALDCRYFPEIFQNASAHDKSALIQASVEYVDTARLVDRVTQIAGEEAQYRDLFYYIFGYLNRKTVDYAEASLQNLFCRLAPKADVSLFNNEEIVQLYSILRLSGLQDIGAELFATYLRAKGWHRDVLQETLTKVLPHGVRWALHNSLKDRHLGDEQVAEMLVLWARELQTSGQSDLSDLFWQAAFGARRDFQVGLLVDYAYRLAAKGDTLGAHACFRKIDRGYAQVGMSGRVPWDLLFGEHTVEALTAVDKPETAPRITIITPTLNQGKYIEQTLSSVVAQNYPNLQYIVVDGGSTDGTLDILQRYRDHIDILISEPDAGQSHAINKGLVQADGDLIGWLNSDDLLAPGALAKLAAAHQADDAEVFAGICCEFADAKLQLVNRPSLGTHGLQPASLADIFGRWFSGEFFNQPEVFFSRDLLARVGILNEDYTYAMDYDLWMRFAKHGVRVCTISWPLALFRLHKDQKIRNRTATVEEQARIRDRHITWGPSYDRRTLLAEKVKRFTESQRGRLHVVSSRMPKIFAARYGDELAGEIGHACSFVDRIDPGSVGDRDMVIKLVHLQNDAEEIAAVREHAPDACLVGWFWDNHHHTDANFEVAESLDIVVPGHSAFESYLRNRHAVQLPTVPLATTQWTQAEAARWSEHIASCRRSSALYGGYIEYGYSDRIKFVKDIQAALPDNNLYSIEERQMHKYFAMTPDARIKDWAGHMVSLVLPLRHDLSQRVFDALLAGQIPLVPDDLLALDRVFGTDAQYELPIVRFRYGDAESVRQAHERAVALLRKDGADGVRRRHNTALEHHMFGARIESILGMLREIDVYTSARERQHA